MESDKRLHFNGLDPSTGAYLFGEQSPIDLARSIAGTGAKSELDEDSENHLADLKYKANLVRNEHLGTLAQDVTNLAETGWAAVFPHVPADSEASARQDAIFAALAPLFDLRRKQAGHRCKIYRGPDGYRQRESKQGFLSRHHAGPGPSDPDRVPYYLLLVASPEEIPFTIQYQLDVQYAVGRIHFDNIDDYAAYASSVVQAETGGLQLAREVAMFAVANDDDPATQLSASMLVAPLTDKLEPMIPDWKFRRILPADATKATLAGLLGGGDATPAVLFTASHGAGFARDNPLQRRHQGALICQDWTGPLKWGRKPLPGDFYLSADDIATTADPHGLIVFNFACYGAGTPQYNDFGQRTGATQREAIADAPFQSALHQRLLSLPRGGALAAVGHVERAWGCSFVWPGSGGRGGGSPAQIAVFENALRRLLAGWPIGAALEKFNERYAELSSDLSVELEEISYGRKYDPLVLADMWTANNDARGYAITGDPAVRIPAAPPGGVTRRVPVERIVLRSAAVAAEPTPDPAPVATPTPAATSTPRPAEPPKASGYNFAVAAGQSPTPAELARVFGGDGILTVRTFITADPAADPVPADTLAVSRVAFDGSVTNALSAAADSVAMQLHAAALQHAQTHRAALLTAIAAISARLRPS